MGLLIRLFKILRGTRRIDGLTQFTLRGRQAVLIDPVILCGECYHGYSCDNRGERSVRVYALFGSAWRMVLSNNNITGDTFVS